MQHCSMMQFPFAAKSMFAVNVKSCEANAGLSASKVSLLGPFKCQYCVDVKERVISLMRKGYLNFSCNYLCGKHRLSNNARLFISIFLAVRKETG